MKNTNSHSQFRGKYQKHLAKMTHAFLLQVLDKPEEEVKKIYESFCNEWTRVVEKVNKQHGAFVLAHESWRNIWERDGYRNIVTKPLAAQEKAALLRIVYIVEGKTEKQRERRELKYKFIFLIVRVKFWWKNLWKKKEKPTSVADTAESLSVVK